VLTSEKVYNYTLLIAQYYPSYGVAMTLMHVFGYTCSHACDFDLSKTVCISNEGASPVQNNFLC